MKKWMAIACGLWVGSMLLAVGEREGQTEPILKEDYVILTLSTDQLEEVEARRRVTLSKRQLKDLRALAPTFPKKVGVASPFVDQIPNSRFSLWPDQVHGIWCAKNEVAIARDSLDGAEGCREFNRKLNVGDAVLIDTGGGYWIGPREVDRETLIESLDKLANKRPEGATFNIFVLRPPTLGKSEDERAVRQAIDELTGLCEERGLRCAVGG